MMVSPLRDVLEEALKLPESDQEAIAKMVRLEIEDRKWQEMLDRRSDVLAKLIEEAREDYFAGRAKELDPDKL